MGALSHTCSWWETDSSRNPGVEPGQYLYVFVTTAWKGLGVRMIRGFQRALGWFAPGLLVWSQWSGCFVLGKSGTSFSGVMVQHQQWWGCCVGLLWWRWWWSCWLSLTCDCELWLNDWGQKQQKRVSSEPEWGSPTMRRPGTRGRRLCLTASMGTSLPPPPEELGGLGITAPETQISSRKWIKCTISLSSAQF